MTEHAENDCFCENGFSSELKATLFQSELLLERWFRQQIQGADERTLDVKTRLQVYQHEINQTYTNLLALQLVDGLCLNECVHNLESIASNTTGLAALPLIDQARYQEEKKDQIKSIIERRKQKISDLIIEHDLHKERALEARKLKENFETSKQTTVNDLTRGIMNYKYVGLDFEKADEERLRLSFTQLDRQNPNQKYSFEIGCTNDIWYIVNVQPVALPEETVRHCERIFNDTDDMATLVKGMREAFQVMIGMSVKTEEK